MLYRDWDVVIALLRENDQVFLKTAQYPDCFYFTESTKMKGLSFTRQNVYNFCVKLDGSDTMKAAAENVLDENYLPSHSDQYRKAYKPAYRMQYKDYRKFKREEERR